MARFAVALTFMALGSFLATAPVWAIAGDRNSTEVGIYAGTGSMDDYGTFDPDDGSLFGVRMGSFWSPKWSAEISAQKLSTDNDLDLDLDVVSFRWNVLYNFGSGRFRPFVTGGLGLEITDIDRRDSSDLGVNAGGGLRWYFADHFGLRLDGRYVYTDVGAGVDDSQGNAEGTLGFLVSWGGGPPPDEDGDGVRDRKDDCPGTPSGAVVDERGCPIDSDGDGVYDGLDKCPGTAAGCPVDMHGCPLDSDGDGVIDCEDDCAGTPEGCTVDASGCPSDADGDGVCDGVDTCPDTPEGCTVDETGCPADEDEDGVCDGVDACPATPMGCEIDETGCPLDEDGDGVCDGLDACPGTPAGRAVDEKGCEPLPDLADLVLEGVTFESSSADLSAGSSELLDLVATSLIAWSEVRVEIEGHTDSTGNDKLNQDLSQKRAESVRDYLIGQGVDPAQLEAKGYGSSQPIAENDTPEGRAKNRRVEMKKLE